MTPMLVNPVKPNVGRQTLTGPSSIPQGNGTNSVLMYTRSHNNPGTALIPDGDNHTHRANTSDTHRDEANPNGDTSHPNGKHTERTHMTKNPKLPKGNPPNHPLTLDTLAPWHEGKPPQIEHTFKSNSPAQALATTPTRVH